MSSDVPGRNRNFWLDGPQLEDCWYGYECRTQREYDHAAKLNVRGVMPVFGDAVSDNPVPCSASMRTHLRILTTH